MESYVVVCEVVVSNVEVVLKIVCINLSYCYVKVFCDGVVDVLVYFVGVYIGGVL